MNVQIDNPISVLNQDVSRTFLVSSKANEKYNMFMKATLLDVIKNNYTEALDICEGEYEKLKLHSEVYLLYLFYSIQFIHSGRIVSYFFFLLCFRPCYK